MNVFRNLAAGSKYLFDAAARLFSPSDDRYPVVGLQPFSGDPYKDNRRWQD